MEKHTTFYQFPKILVIKFQRFDRHGNKINKGTVEIPRMIDLRRYGTYAPDKEIAKQYKHFATCKHFGDSIGSGYYEA